MIEKVDQIVANPRWKEPFEIEGCDLISKISFLWLIAQDTRLSMLEPAKAEHWKKKYLAVWDPYMDRVLGPNPKPDKKKAAGESCREIRPAHSLLQEPRTQALKQVSSTAALSVFRRSKFTCSRGRRA